MARLTGNSATSIALGVDGAVVDRQVPRVLIVGPDLPNLGAAGAIQLYRLFQGWPPQSLLAAGPEAVSNIQKLACRFMPYRPPLIRLETTRAFRFVRLLRAWRAVPAGRLKIPEFRPAAVVHILSSLAYSEAAYSYSRQSGVPLILIVHDDPEDFNKSYTWTRGAIRRQVERIYRHASVRLCVSPDLERILHARYGVAGVVMFPIRSEALTARPPEASLSLKQPHKLTLGFAGSLSYGYGPRLFELVPLLRKSRARVRVYGCNLSTGEYSDVLIDQGRLATPEEAWTRIKNECDAVLLPYCFANHGHQTLYRTHFPSKLPEYLALGMPVIIAGPRHATGVQWGLRNPAACIVITEQGGEEWVNVLTRVRRDDALRLGLAKNAVLAGNAEFDPSSIRTLFTNAVSKAAPRVVQNPITSELSSAVSNW